MKNRYDYDCKCIEQETYFSIVQDACHKISNETECNSCRKRCFYLCSLRLFKWSTRNVAKAPAAPAITSAIALPHISQKAVNVSFTVKGGSTVIVKLALLVMYPIVGYFLDIWNSGSAILVTVSLNIGNFDDVVCINIEAKIGISYTPTGVCGEAFTLNNGGWTLSADTFKPSKL